MTFQALRSPYRALSGPSDASLYHNPHCWIAKHGVFEGPATSCDGELVKCHLIPRMLLRKNRIIRQRPWQMWNDALWVWACGGLSGSGGHHGAFDTARTIRIPRNEIPLLTEAFAQSLGLEWWLERTYGKRDSIWVRLDG